MNNTCRVDILESTKNLVQKVLDKLLLQRPRCEETVEIGAEELSYEIAVTWSVLDLLSKVKFDVHILERRNEDVA